jgi:outer membrane lipoprotein LolB
MISLWRRLPSLGVSWCIALAMALVTGCATPPRPAAAVAVDRAAGPWSGRLALQVADKPGQSFSAGFELKGDARAGELTLYSPLGGTLAALAWRPGSATLGSGGQLREFASLDELVAQVAGEPIPIAALFDWLRGLDTPVAGWRADLSQLAQGRVAAKRLQPAPEADLRLVLER